MPHPIAAPGLALTAKSDARAPTVPVNEQAIMVTSASGSSVGRIRDVRLDLFRGLAMLIILIAHIPDNSWNAWIPARFGFSSGAEMFVFCSGFASAMAFGSVFQRHGLAIGAARIAYRIWQLYWAQIALFLVIAAITLSAIKFAPHGAYLEFLSLDWFLASPGDGLLALLTLRYIPNLFDMLPMYMAILASVPLAMMLARISPRLVMTASVGLWLIVQITGYNLSSRPNSDLVWYFNPLAWQLLFYTGFSFGMGWLPAPQLGERRLTTMSAAIVLLSIPLTFWAFVDNIPLLDHLRALLIADTRPTSLHIVRYAHFLALAYLAVSFVDRYRRELAEEPRLKPIIRIGQQTLAVFLSSIAIAWTLGIALDIFGRDAFNVALANLTGMTCLFLVAYVVAWFKRQPWKERATPARRNSEISRIAMQPAE